MRELNSMEIAEVSGAGVIATITSGIGSTLGGLADSVASIFGLTTTFSSAAQTLGNGIGQVIELNFTEGKSNISSGISGLIAAVTSIFSTTTDSSSG